MGSQVTVENEGNQVVVKSGRTVIKIPMMGWETFPEFDFYDSSEFREFTKHHFGKSNKLKWATSNINSDPKSCVYVRGNKMYATNNFKAARIVLDADTGVTALTAANSFQSCSVRSGRASFKEQNHLIIAPDDYSQLLMQLMDDSSYPANNIDKMMEEPYQYKSSFAKSEAIRIWTAFLRLWVRMMPTSS